MFAGPNGSGKSVLKSYLPEPLLGVYLNPDEIEAGIKKSGYADIHRFGIQSTQEEILSAFTGSKFLQEKGFSDAARSLSFEDGRLFFTSDVGNSYFASVLVDFIRGKLLKVRQTFTFETVMSHPGKVALFQQARRLAIAPISLLCGHRRPGDQCLPCGKPCRVERARCADRRVERCGRQLFGVIE